MKFTTILPLSCLSTLAFGATHDVTVGPSLIYTPDTVTAAQGDVVRFHFGAGHNVVSGKFNSPCQPDNMIYSGMPNEGDVFSVTINNTNPIWIYCSVPHHCESGMAMVINAPSNETIGAYKSAASSVSSSGTPSSVGGGVLNAQASSSASMSSMSSASSTASGTASSTSSAASSSSTSHSGASSLSSSSSTFLALAVALGLTVRAW